MYKVNREAVPSYILDLFPPIVGDTNPYPLRNSQNLTIPYSRTAVSMKSCILSGINLWNYLDDSLKNRESLQSFKHAFKLLSGIKKFHLITTLANDHCKFCMLD